MIYLIAYDIAEDDRRAALAGLLSGHGARVQLSVFECEIADREELEMLVGHIERLLEPVEDQVRLYPLNVAAVREMRVLGLRTLEERRDFWIL